MTWEDFLELDDEEKALLLEEAKLEIEALEATYCYKCYNDMDQCECVKEYK